MIDPPASVHERPKSAAKQFVVRSINFVAAPFLGKGLAKFYPFRIVRSWYRDFVGTGKSVSVYGFTLFLDPLDASGFEQKKGNYEPETTEVFRRELRPEDTVLDIGANIGYFTLFAAQRAKKVYAFEPNPKTFELLSKNVETNGFADKVVMRSDAVAEKPGECDFFLCDATSGFHARGIRVKVPTVAIDDVVPTADFIKIDVEGAELAAIKGGKRIFSGARVVIFEFHPRLIERFGIKPNELLEMMRGIGFHLTVIGDEKFDGLVERLEKSYSSVNILAKKA